MRFVGPPLPPRFFFKCAFANEERKSRGRNARAQKYKKKTNIKKEQADDRIDKCVCAVPE